MDIVFHTGDVPNALLLMLLGLVGIFVVMGLIMGAVFLLNRFAGDKPKDPEQKDKK